LGACPRDPFDAGENALRTKTAAAHALEDPFIEAVEAHRDALEARVA